MTFRTFSIAPAVLVVILFSATIVQSIDVPKEIAGFRLGEDITEYSGIEYSNYLKEVVVTDWHGFRKGVISYGICAAPGKIVRIVMKYEDSSEAFFDDLLKKFKRKFGKPSIWGGDAFGILSKWKWVFTDAKNNLKVNLILQHNLKNHDENIGNVVKLYYPEREKEERLCFIQQCDIKKTTEQKEQLQEREKLNWEYLVPK